MTARAIITSAYRDAQKLGRLAILAADQEAEGLEKLADLTNMWITRGMKLFLEEEVTVPLVAGKAVYSIMPGGDINMARPIKVLNVSYWLSDDTSHPIFSIGRDEWSSLSQRAAAGSVNQFYSETLFDRVNLHLTQVPDATNALGSLRVVVKRQAVNPITIDASILFPPEWAIALRWGLADEIATGMPESVQQRCQVRAQTYRQALEDYDVEDVEVVLQPDSRMFGFSRFR